MSADFQKRHYERIASELRFVRSYKDSGTIDELAYRFARLFGQDNPHFHEASFLKAVMATDDDPAPYPRTL